MKYDFGELVQNFELERVGGAPNGYPLAPLVASLIRIRKLAASSSPVPLSFSVIQLVYLD